MSDITTTPLDEDVENTDEQSTEVQEEVVEEVQQETSADTADYDSAWDNVDTNNPSDELFGMTNDVDTETESKTELVEDVVEDVQQVETNGLMIKNPVLKYKGRDIPVDSEEEAINLMQKGFKLESEMSKIKPYKGYINILNDGDITIEDLQTFKDALGGNDGAKRTLATRFGGVAENGTGSFFDETPAKEESTYKPEVKTEDQVSDYFATLTEENPEVAGKISQVYSDIEDEFKVEVYNPQVFPMFASSIASGEFDRLYPIAIKLRLGNPGLTWLQAYQMAGKGGQTETKAVVPPKSTQTTRSSGSKPRTTGDSYDRAFSMDTKELEAKLFG